MPHKITITLPDFPDKKADFAKVYRQIDVLIHTTFPDVEYDIKEERI